jgi:signal transduction histidine kinase
MASETRSLSVGSAPPETGAGAAGAGAAGAGAAGPERSPGPALAGPAVAFFWLTVVAAVATGSVAGAALLGALPPAAGAAGGPTADPVQLAVVAGLVLAAAVAQHFPITLNPGHKATLAVAVCYAAALLLGPALAVPVVALSQALGQGTLMLRRSGGGGRARGLRGAVFNTAQAVLATAAGSVVYAVLLPYAGATGPVAGTVPAGPLGLVAAAVAAAAMFLVNTALVATIVALQRGGRPWEVWRAGQRGRLPEVAGQFLVGYFVAWALPREPWLLVPAALAAVVLSRSLARRSELARQATELARREAEASALRELARRKDEFLGTVSHELRTPLSIVCGYADLLLARRTGLDASASQMVDAMLGSAMQLSRMVDDLLEFARVERGNLPLRLEATDLTRVTVQTVAGFERHEGAERIRLELPEQLPAYADPTRVAQALTNLITNALKYAPEGPVVIRGGAADAVRIEVADHGPGIPQAEHLLVWETFYRGSGGSRRGAPRGTGIGLSVVKAVIEAQGGRVGLESDAGAGSRFWFELPADAASAGAGPAGSPPAAGAAHGPPGDQTPSPLSPSTNQAA